MPRWTTEIEPGHQFLYQLREWWDQQPAALANPLLNSLILEKWRNGLEEAGSEFHIIVLSRDGEPVAALPLYKARFQYRTLHRTYASSMDIVGSPDAEASGHLLPWIAQLGVVHLYRLPDDSPLVEGVESRPRWITESRHSSPYVDLLGGINQVQSGWTRNFQKSLDRRWRRLQEKGEVRYVSRHATTEIGAVVSEGLHLEDSGWKGRDGVSVLRRPGYERWFRDIAEIGADRDWLRIGALYLEDRMIAFCFDLTYGGRRHSLLSAYVEDAEIARTSPGNALIRLVLEDSAAEGDSTYEFGYGSQPWKYDWTSRERRVNDIVAVGSNFTGRAYALLRRIRPG